MILKTFFIAIVLMPFGINCSYAQENEVDSSKVDTTETVTPNVEIEEEETNVETEVEIEKEENKNTDSDGGSVADGEINDRNLGTVFDGATVSIAGGFNYYYGDLANYNLIPRASQMKQHLRTAFRFSIAREIIFGIGGQLNFQKGTLIGSRQTGKYSDSTTFENHFSDFSFQATYLLNNVLFKKNKYNRFRVYAHLGIGGVWYRSQRYDPKTLNTKDYEGYVATDETAILSQKTLSDKVKKAKALTVPFGIRLNYKFNYKLDFHLDFTQTHTTTDRLDAFRRDWTAKDKYQFIGLGVTYNFNRVGDEDAPEIKEKEKKEKNEENATDDTSSTSDNGAIRNSLLGKKSSKKKKKKSGEDDELLNVRLKMFEIQLKLFEMQYLLGH